jgi:hypothetical protein
MSKYMRVFSEVWPDRAIVQGPLAQLPKELEGVLPSAEEIEKELAE